MYSWGNRLISVGETILPTLFQALRSDTFAEARSLAPGSPSHDGTVKTAHHIPESPIAKRNEAVDPSPRVTGTINSARTVTPEKKPRATPFDEMRDIVSDRSSAWRVVSTAISFDPMGSPTGDEGMAVAGVGMARTVDNKPSSSSRPAHVDRLGSLSLPTSLDTAGSSLASPGKKALAQTILIA